MPDRLADANDLVGLVLEPALHRRLDLDPQIVLDSVLHASGEVRYPTARIRRDVLDEGREVPESCQRAAREFERAVDHGTDAIERGLHALVQQADGRGEGCP